MTLHCSLRPFAVKFAVILTVHLNQSTYFLKISVWSIIECPVSGVPQPTVTWSINDSPLTPKDRIRLLDNNRQLTIDMAQVADTAVYMCVAVNKAGELRKKFQLEVLGKGN